MNRQERRRHDADRALAGHGFAAACYAPFNTLYLHTTGRVTACCVSTHVLGNVAESSLLDIWQGTRAQELRQAVVDYDLSRGCSFCQWQVAQPGGGPAFAVEFDSFAVEDTAPPWPKRLEFEISNTCNLECVMCNGDLSSTIRSRREGRPPMPKVYGDAFFEELRSFLPHLESAAFLGGEPFLAKECFRVWDLMDDMGLAIPCSVVTNGTHWNARVEQALHAQPMSITVSLDGVTAATVERIRVGASFAQIMDNLARFRAYTTERGTELRLAFCLLRENWREFGDYLLLADDLAAPVRVNTVTDPVHGLAQLPFEELAPIVASLEASDDEMTRRLGRNRGVWADELARLRGWRTARAAGATAPGDVTARSLYLFDSRAGTIPDDLRNGSGPDGEVTVADATSLVLRELPACPVSVLYCDDEDRVVAVGPAEDFLGVPRDRCVGRSFDEIVHELQDRYGQQMDPLDTEVIGGGVLRRVVHRTDEGGATYLAGYGFPGRVPDGAAGSVTVAGWSRTTPTWAPLQGTAVRLSSKGAGAR